MTQHMACLVNAPCAHENCLLQLCDYMSIRSSRSIALFKSSVSLMLFWASCVEISHYNKRLVYLSFQFHAFLPGVF